MSKALSPSFACCYGLARVARVWKISGASVYRSLKETPPNTSARRPGPEGNPSACVGCQVSSTWLATARGRVGVAWDRLLFYGTVGAAFQNVKFAVTAPPLINPLASTVSPFGWAAGGGVEFAISPNWSVKTEYLYVDFQNQTIGPGTFRLIENVVRGGVNYRF